MAEEFQSAVYGGSWWMSPRTAFNRSSCSSVIIDMENFGPCWPRDHLMNMKLKSSYESSDVNTSDWNQNLMVQDELNNFSTSGDDCSIAVIEAENQLGFTMDQQQLLNFTTSSGDWCPSSLLPPPLTPPLPQQQPLYDYQSNSNSFIQSLPSLKQHVPGDFHLTNNTPFWNASSSSLDDNISSFFPTPSSQFLPSSYKEVESCPNLTVKQNRQEIMDSGSTAKSTSGELPFKRPRLETPSPLPTFKVRKEKLGDRITALQQLVSPFGKTDTASVLHEAIEYVKLLHDQVNILSAPYMKNGATKQFQQIRDKVKDAEEPKQDLRSLGLCLVPVSSTFPLQLR